MNNIVNVLNATELYILKVLISSYVNFTSFLKNVYLFILTERESNMHKLGRGRERERQRDRETERIPSRLHAISTEPNVGLERTNHEIMT